MINLKVNGDSVSLEVEPDMPLLWALRDILGLTGTKFGCGMAMCGACTVHIDGEATRSCVIPVSAVAGKEITTIEGLSPSGEHPLQKAWVAEGVPQCGYCQSGQIMTAASFLKKHPKPDETQIVEAMTGNLCRCGTYGAICSAVARAAKGGNQT